MRILVTGRQGQLARALAERARTVLNVELITASRPELDLAVPGSAAAAIARIRPDVVVNAAAYTAVDRAEDEPDLAFRINADAAGEVAAAACAVGAPVIQLSTDYVFAGTATEPYREDDRTGPGNVYGASKLAGEAQVRGANRDHAILRTSWVMSPFGRNFARTMVEAARSRPELSVVADQRGRPTSALDLADAVLRVAMAGAFGETFHVANSGVASWFEVAVAIMDECRSAGARTAEIRPIGTADWPTPAARPLYSVLDCSKFEAAVGKPLRDWRGSLSLIVQRILAEGETAAS